MRHSAAQSYLARRKAWRRNRKHGLNIAAGMRAVRKLAARAMARGCFAGLECMELELWIAREVVARLERLGWYWSVNTDCMAPRHG